MVEPQRVVEQRSVGIDVEIIDPRQHARILPTIELVACRYERQPAAEIAQRRTRQTFDQSFAIITFGVFGRDQQMLR